MSKEIYGGACYEDIGTSKRNLEGKLYRLVAVSFGLLCVLQAGLNITLRIRLSLSESSEEKTSDIKDILNMTKERDELKRKLTLFDEYSRKGWVYFNNSFYYISSRTESWKDSRKDCQQRDADLVIINSKEEQKLLIQLGKDVWIGLSDQETEGAWKWVDGTVLTTSYWGINEPNSHEGKEEDCGEIKFYEKGNSWNDKPCDSKNVWICEKMAEHWSD
ncbi:CD209 antigen-like protein C [Channa argus]|uniref:CD209 antigen-like protein C n=1 Tax=Channa argus TaxID=215402 RepID=UPI003520AA94